MERQEERPTSAGGVNAAAHQRTEYGLGAVVVPLADVPPGELDRPLHVSEEIAGRAPAAGPHVWRWTVTVEGTCARESTTSTDRRRDALLSATRFIEMAKRIVRFEPNHLDASVAHEPGASLPNGSAGRYVLHLELREADAATVGRVYDRLTSEAWTIGRLSRTRFDFQPYLANPTMLYGIAAEERPARQGMTGD
jgi:hypothetical protein